MFATLEAAIIAHLADCLPGQPVHDTYAALDLSGPGAPTVAMQVVWLGAAIASAKRHEIKLAHRFALYVYVDTGRARPTDRAAATTALQTALGRLLAFEPDRFNFAEMTEIPEPDYDGRALRLALYFSLSDVARRVSP